MFSPSVDDYPAHVTTTTAPRSLPTSPPAAARGRGGRARARTGRFLELEAVPRNLSVSALARQLPPLLFAYREQERTRPCCRGLRSHPLLPRHAVGVAARERGRGGSSSSKRSRDTSPSARWRALPHLLFACREQERTRPCCRGLRPHPLRPRHAVGRVAARERGRGGSSNSKRSRETSPSARWRALPPLLFACREQERTRPCCRRLRSHPLLPRHAVEGVAARERGRGGSSSSKRSRETSPSARWRGSCHLSYSRAANRRGCGRAVGVPADVASTRETPRGLCGRLDRDTAMSVLHPGFSP